MIIRPQPRPRLWRPDLVVPDRRNLVGAARVGASGAAGRLLAGGPIEHVGTKSLYTAASGLTVHTTSFAVATTGPNRFLAVPICDQGETVNSVTYNGQSLADAQSNGRAKLYYLLDTDFPNDGNNHDLVVTYAVEEGTAFIGGIEYKNVNQAAPDDADLANVASGGLASITLNSLSEGSLIIKVAGNSGNQAFVDGAGEVSRYSATNTAGWPGFSATDKVGVDAGDETVTADPAGSPFTNMVAAAWSEAA